MCRFERETLKISTTGCVVCESDGIDESEVCEQAPLLALKTKLIISETSRCLKLNDS